MADEFIKRPGSASPDRNVDETTEAELHMWLIQQYADLQRIKNAADMEKELDIQIKIAKKKLEVFGVDTDKLDF